MSDWYYDVNGQASAPVTKATLGAMLAGGQINRQTQVIRDGIQWTPLEDVAELRDILPVAPAQSYSPIHENAEWWVRVNNDPQKGPFTKSKLKEMLNANQISRESLVWKDGFDVWVKMGTVTELW